MPRRLPGPAIPEIKVYGTLQWYGGHIDERDATRRTSRTSAVIGLPACDATQELESYPFDAKRATSTIDEGDYGRVALWIDSQIVRAVLAGRPWKSTWRET